MANDLLQYGIYENKTLYTRLPIFDDYLMPHLIRGILDGDGNIKAHQFGNRYAHAISFCGTHELMSGIKEYLVNTLGVFPSIVFDYDDRHLSEVKWQSIKDMYKIGEWMYRDANIYLTRKHDKYLDFKKHYKL